ncbi:MAG TPA: DUF2905 family protein [Myxococcaceae bacterium]|nr:DUF2905 family protein [Myxococcaceae bacterium]
MDSKSAGWALVAIGSVVVVLGLLVWTGALSWFGRLPGDLRWEGEHSRVYAPFASLLLLSAALSLGLYLFRRWF